jgi:SAM-dependent methyltransferase
MGVKRLLQSTHLWGLVAPGYPDTARQVAQEPIFRDLLRSQPFTGVCLNAGCGDGMYVPFLESFVGINRIENIDLADPTALRARFADPRNRFTQGSLTELPFQSETFDCCMCSEVIEHIEDHERAIAELARVLKPNGLLLASVPQIPAPWDPAHVREGYTFEQFKEILERSHFRVLARRDCFFVLTRAIMSYWRRPWIRFGAMRCPYVPEWLIRSLARLDGKIGGGKPWDLAVLAARV